MAHIHYDANTPWGRRMAAFAAALREVIDEGERIQAAMDSIAAGGGSPVALEDATFGFGVATGTGAALYSAHHDGIMVPLRTITVATVSSLDLGA